MKPQFDNIMLQSFILWLDNRICAEGSGFQTVSSNLYPQVDTSRQLYSYASPYKQWIYDGCVPGAVIPSGVYNDQGQYLTRASGVIFDWNEGRILSTGNLGKGLSGTFSRKEYNVYNSTEEAISFYLEQGFRENKNLSYFATGNYPYQFAAPCIVVTNSFGSNEAYAFGGLQQSKRIIRLFCINDNNYNAEALNTIITDSKDKYFSMIPFAEMPLKFYGDMKTGYYSYCDLKDRYPCGDGVYIENVYSFKLNEKTNQNKTFSISLYELDVKKVRYPGQL